MLRDLPMADQPFGYFVYFNDFLCAADFNESAEWIRGDIGAPTAPVEALLGMGTTTPGAIGAGAAGVLQLASGTGGANTGTQTELYGTTGAANHTALSWVVAADKPFAWGARIRLGTAATTGMAIGLIRGNTTNNDLGTTDLLATGGTISSSGISDASLFNVSTAGVVAYYHEAGGTALTINTAGNGDNVWIGQVPTITAATWLDVAVRIDPGDVVGSSVLPYGSATVYLNGIKRARASYSSRSIFGNVGLHFAMAVMSESATSRTVDVDHIWFVGRR
jgi:hypothetical protein